MADFVDPNVIAQIEQAKTELVGEVVKAKECVEKICEYSGSLPNPIIPEAPVDNKTYGRKNKQWVEVTGGEGSTVWGDITGTLSNQADLQTALDAKANDDDLAVVAKSGRYSDLVGLPALIPEAPKDGEQYARQDGAWEKVVLNLPKDPTLEGSIKFQGQDPSGRKSFVLFEPYGASYSDPTRDWIIKGSSLYFGEYAWQLKSNSEGFYWAGEDGNFKKVALADEVGKAAWGSITGTLTDQADLREALAAKANRNSLGEMAYVNDVPNDVFTYGRKGDQWVQIDSGGSEPTNLGVTYAGGNVTITSSTGSSASIVPATQEDCGVMSPIDKVKLDGIQAKAQVNKFDAYDAPSDNKIYGRMNGAWEEVGGTAPEYTINGLSFNDSPNLVFSDKFKVSRNAQQLTQIDLDVTLPEVPKPTVQTIELGAKNINFDEASFAVAPDGNNLNVSFIGGGGGGSTDPFSKEIEFNAFNPSEMVDGSGNVLMDILLNKFMNRIVALRYFSAPSSPLSKFYLPNAEEAFKAGFPLGGTVDYYGTCRDFRETAVVFGAVGTSWVVSGNSSINTNNLRYMSPVDTRSATNLGNKIEIGSNDEIFVMFHLKYTLSSWLSSETAAPKYSWVAHLEQVTPTNNN